MNWIIPYVITWDGIVSKYHTKHRKELGITDRIEAYIQSTTLKKTLESISMEGRSPSNCFPSADTSHKYDLLTNHLTTFHKQYRNLLNIDSRTHAYVHARNEDIENLESHICENCPMSIDNI
ncbi:hypothetical protein NAPIS_ORF00674 [Vairimorpha apis BRL 01]|uniref:Uncharacterized protein n=1 Tax=Vairimorpha apis BRL 01 TaxID=1037528 RepID=T0MF98_9MICR|nr:hypothetical protein NAPIS_ORF00674 [Vairimorpha apis BRL 01]